MGIKQLHLREKKNYQKFFLLLFQNLATPLKLYLMPYLLKYLKKELKILLLFPIKKIVTYII